MQRNEIIERLCQEARRLKVGRKLPPPEDGPLARDLVEAVQSDLQFVLAQDGVTVEMISAAMGPGFGHGLISRFKTMKRPEDFYGDLDRVVRGVNQFLETIGRRADVKGPAGWVETDVARKMLLVVAKTIELASIGIIYGDAGRGKTLTLKAAAEIHPGSLLIRVEHSTRTPAGFIKRLGRQLNQRGCTSTYTAQEKVTAALEGTGRALLIDEAHQLRPNTLEMLRDLHDSAGVPIVLVGTVKIAEAVSDNDLYFGQLSSRVALRYDITEDLRPGPGGGTPKPLHTLAEIQKLYASDKVRFTDEARLLLTKIANLPGLGGLRLCAKVVQVARAAAQGEAIDAPLVMKVIRMLQGREFSTRTIEQAVERSEVRIA